MIRSRGEEYRALNQAITWLWSTIIVLSIVLVVLTVDVVMCHRANSILAKKLVAVEGTKTCQQQLFECRLDRESLADDWEEMRRRVQELEPTQYGIEFDDNTLRLAP